MSKKRRKEGRLADSFSGPRVKGFFSFLSGQSESFQDDPAKRKKAFDKVLETVKKRYPVVSADSDPSGIFIKIIVKDKHHQEGFEKIRRELKPFGFFPKLIDTGRETIIAVFPLPRKKPSNTTTNLILLLLTIFTTIWAGAMLWEERSGTMEDFSDLLRVLIDPVDLGMGAVTFALPLLLILGTHELGHYFTSRRYQVDASLPYFIPVPPMFSPFGTFGALISMKEPISNRRALVDIGAAGPIAGFIVAIPVTFIGLLLTGSYPSSMELIEGAQYLEINPPLLFRAMMVPLGIANEDNLFPTALAGWIGLFVTSINLFPAGQLDGGHIARGVLGEGGKILSFSTVAILLLLGFLTPFKTYLLFAFLILLMGARHPPPLDDMSRLSRKQYATAGIALVIMVLTFHPLPIEIVSIGEGGVEIHESPPELNLSSETPTVFQVTVKNTGSLEKDVQMRMVIDGQPLFYDPLLPEPDWNSSTFGPIRQVASSLWAHEGWFILLMDPVEMEVKGGEGKTLTWNLVMGCSRNVTEGDQAVLDLGFSTKNQVAWTTIPMICKDL
jgi:membrane-associated protease RseP (regulator of RpoE activity)